MRKGEMKGGKLTPALNVVVLLANLSPLHLERERLDVKLGKEAVVDKRDTCGGREKSPFHLWLLVQEPAMSTRRETVVDAGEGEHSSLDGNGRQRGVSTFQEN
jgi:hypothetical protein